MINHATEHFWKLFAALPQMIQELARKQFHLFEQDPHHASLQFKRLVGTRHEVWSARVDNNYRALAVRTKDAQSQEAWLWFWIGTHREYEKLANRL